jgi:hypothetical protein
MQHRQLGTIIAAIAVTALISGCGVVSPQNAVGGQSGGDTFTSQQERNIQGGTTIWDAFSNRNSETVVGVNKYIWSASLEVLNFLPVESVDPFTGVIITGFGNPPGGGREYRATVLIQDAALDARSLNLSMNTRGGPADTATVRAVEDAILTRARQLRIADEKL